MKMLIVTRKHRHIEGKKAGKIRELKAIFLKVKASNKQLIKE